MSVNRLYPPILAGTIPSFYTTTTGTSLEVPFSMNATVNKNAVRGIQLRLKTTSTDIILADIESGVFAGNGVNRSVIYTLDSSIVNKLVVGNFYKIQLAYVDTNGVKGYYSTVAVVKYTKKPTVTIAGLNLQSATTISDSALVGQYHNEDISEKVYQYRFVLMTSNNQILEDSGWLLHNSSNDTEQDTSQDYFVSKYNITESQVYRVQYSISTNNGLIAQSVVYDIIKSTVMGAALEVFLTPSLDYENGRILIAVAPLDAKREEYPLSGSYVLSRRSDKAGQNTQWEVVKTVQLNITINRKKPYVFYDYSIEAGELYTYSLQKFNSNNIYSRRVIHDQPIAAKFEDAFLYDGTRQLRIRFNPNVSSFKSVVAETKKTTLGRQFPFILRNGVLNYKEFPITGLISYQMDNDELFLSKSDWRYVELKQNQETGEIIHRSTKPFESSTQLSDENFDFERLFKLEVLEWLNNGGIKLFKSPQEGNYIVRLTNISLSPNTTVSRMLHSFNCTASEVAKYSINALSEYSLLGDQNDNIKLQEAVRVELSSIWAMFHDTEKVAKYDILNGRPCTKVVFEANFGSEYNAYGLTFQWGEYNFAIDRSGQYELELEGFIQAPLYIMNLTEYSSTSGTLILYVESSDGDRLDAVSSSNIQYMYGYSAYGSKEAMEYEVTVKDKPSKKYSRNILREFNNVKTVISQIIWIEYSTIPVYELTKNYVYDEKKYDSAMSAAWDLDLGAFGSAGQYYGDNVFIKDLSTSKYYKYVPSNTHYQRDAQGKLPLPIGPGAKNSWFKEVTDYGTEILIGDYIIDINKITTGGNAGMAFDFHKEFPESEDEGLVLRIQPGVRVTIYGKHQTDTYFVESEKELVQASTEESMAYEDYCMHRFNFAVADINNITKDDLVYIFQNRTFVAISPSDATSWKAADYTIYKPYWPSVYSEAKIRQKYLAYIDKKEDLDDLLRLNLKED